MTLDGLDRLSIDDVAEFLDYLEAETAFRKREEDRERAKAEASASSRPKGPRR